MRHSISALLPLLFTLSVPLVAAPPSHEVIVLIGTYTTGASTGKGIYRMRLNLDTGQLPSPGLVAGTVSPSGTTLDPKTPLLYAANEVSRFPATPGGGVSAFSIAKHGSLKPLTQQGSGGSGPCYVAVDRNGTRVLVANYGSGSVASLPIESSGKLKPASATVQHEGSSVDPNRQKGPHAHSINTDPANHYALAADLGLDKVLVYKIDAKGSLTPNDPP